MEIEQLIQGVEKAKKSLRDQYSWAWLYWPENRLDLRQELRKQGVRDELIRLGILTRDCLCIEYVYLHYGKFKDIVEPFHVDPLFHYLERYNMTPWKFDGMGRWSEKENYYVIIKIRKQEVLQAFFPHARRDILDQFYWWDPRDLDDNLRGCDLIIKRLKEYQENGKDWVL